MPAITARSTYVTVKLTNIQNSNKQSIYHAVR